MVLKRPLFAPLGEQTMLAFVVSVPASVFIFMFGAFWPPEVVNLLAGKTSIGSFFEWVAFTIILALPWALIMLVPTFVLAVPLYKFVKAQSGITLQSCLIVASLVCLPLSVLHWETKVSNFLFLLIPCLIAVLIFHRLDQSRWFRSVSG